MEWFKMNSADFPGSLPVNFRRRHLIKIQEEVSCLYSQKKTHTHK